MSRFVRVLAPAALLLSALAAAPAQAHEGNPQYRSVVRSIAPATPGLQARVLDHDDALQLVNRSGKAVVILGYAGDPYARVLADGTVQVNERSPDVALDEDAHQHDAVDTTAPAGAPRWHTLDRTGRFEWHDHRIHYRDAGLPRPVTDRTKETKVFDWQVPLRVGARRGAIAGTLAWVGEPGSSSFPTAAVVSLAVLALLAIGAVALVRRRRAEQAR